MHYIEHVLVWVVAAAGSEVVALVVVVPNCLELGTCEYILKSQ